MAPAVSAAAAHSRRGGQQSQDFSGAGAAGAASGSAVRRNGLRQAKAADILDAAMRLRAGSVPFGPGKCIRTWRNADGHCEIETKCKGRDLSKYTVKLICVDENKEKVRHVFAAGSFDTEEQFDTLIKCQKCQAEKEETVEVISESSEKDDGGDEPAGKEKDPGGATLKALKDEVKELEGFMLNTSAQVKKLNAEVYGGSFKPKKTYTDPAKHPGAIGKKAAARALTAKEAAASSSLVHHTSGHLRHRPLPLHEEVQAARIRREHRRHLADDTDDAEPAKHARRATARAPADVPASLAGALSSAEDKDDQVPAQQPARLPMGLPKTTKVETEVDHFKEDDDDEKDDGYGDDSIEETGRDPPPSLSALQRDVDEDDSVDDADEDLDGDADAADAD